MNQIVDIDKLLDDLQYSISGNVEDENSGACQSRETNKPSRSSDVCPSAEPDSCIVYPSFSEEDQEKEEKDTSSCHSPSVARKLSSTPVPSDEGLIHASSSPDQTEIISISLAVEALAPSSFPLTADNPLSGVVGGVATELEQKAVSIPPNQETTDTPQLSLVLPDSTSEMCNCSPRPESAQEEFHSLAAEPSSFSSFDWTNLTPANNSRAEHFSSAAQSANNDRAISTGLSRISFPAESGSMSKVAAVSTSDSAVFGSPPNHLSPCDFSIDCQCVQSPNSPGFPAGKVCEPPEETTPFGQSRMINMLPGSSSARATTGMDAASEPHIRLSSAVVTTPRTGGRSMSGNDLSGTNIDTQEAPPPASLPFVTGDEVGVELPVEEEALVPIEFPASDQKDGVHTREDDRVGEAEVPTAEQSTAAMTDTADWLVSMSPDEIGTREPTWVADDAYANCMSCGAKFTVWRRRHHCRTCGRLLCAQCTPARLRLAFGTTISQPAASETTTATTAEVGGSVAPISANQLRPSTQSHGRPNPNLEQRLMKLISGQAGRLHRVCSDCFEVLSVHPDSNPDGNAEHGRGCTRSQHQTSAALDSSASALGENATPLPPRRVFSPQDAVNALMDTCLIPSPVVDELGRLEFRWPPLAVQSDNSVELQPNPSAEELMSLLGPSSAATATELTDALPGATFAITRNLLVHVYLTPLTCCLAQDAWCFISSGLQAVGHNEVLLFIRRRPNELLPPVDVLWQYFALYDMTLNRGRASRSQPCDISSPRLRDGICLLEPLSSYTATNQPLAWFQELPSNQDGQPSTPLGWAGFLYFHPNNQCLLNLRLPEPPFLCGVLVHTWEAAWARHLPLRLLLQLGKSANSSPTNSLSPSLLSDRERPSVFSQAAPPDSILSVFFPDLAGLSEAEVSTDMPFLHVPRLEIVLRGKEEDNSLQLQLTFNSLSSHLAKSLFNKRLHSCLLLGLSGDFVRSAAYHLVCSYPSEGGGCQTESLPCGLQDQASRTMPTTGASFVVFEGGADQLSLSIVEDGCVVRLTAEQFALLTSALRSRRPLSLNAGSTQNANASPTISVVWQDEEADVNLLPSPFTTRFSWIDGRPIPSRLTFCIQPEQQLRHWLMTTQQSPLRTASPLDQAQTAVAKPLVAWVRLHKLGESTVFAVDNQSGESLDLSAVTNAIVCALISALVPYVQKLLASNVIQFALRIRLQPPTVFNFVIGSPALWSSVRTFTTSSSTGGVDVTFRSDTSSLKGWRRWQLQQSSAAVGEETAWPSQLPPLLEDSGYINDVDSALIPMLDGLTRNITCRRLLEQAAAADSSQDDMHLPPPALEFEFDFTLHA